MMAELRSVHGVETPLIVDSVTDIGDRGRDAVVVSGSHGGIIAVRYGAAAGVRGLIVNDAGGGKDDAGIAGLSSADDWGIAVAAVAATTARIGDGADTYASGIISHANRAAASVGVITGMTAREAALRLGTRSVILDGGVSPPKPDRRLVLSPSDPPVIGLDSASQVDSTLSESIVVCGSHGGIVGGRPIRSAVLAAFFNDAGIGKDDAGIQRLPALAAMGIAACAISHLSARIGDARDAYENGVLSRVNDLAASAGLREGMSVAAATELLGRRLSNNPSRQERRD